MCPILIALRVSPGILAHSAGEPRERHRNHIDREQSELQSGQNAGFGGVVDGVPGVAAHQRVGRSRGSPLSAPEHQKEVPHRAAARDHQPFRLRAKEQQRKAIGFSDSQSLCKIFLELMKSSVLPLSHVSLFVLFSLTDAERFRPSVYSFLLSQLQHEFNSVWYRWNYPIIVVPGLETSETLVESFLSLVDVVESGYQEGAELLIHWNDYLLHWTGHSSSTSLSIVLIGSFGEAVDGPTGSQLPSLALRSRGVGA